VDGANGELIPHTWRPKSVRLGHSLAESMRRTAMASYLYVGLLRADQVSSRLVSRTGVSTSNYRVWHAQTLVRGTGIEPAPTSLLSRSPDLRSVVSELVVLCILAVARHLLAMQKVVCVILGLTAMPLDVLETTLLTRWCSRWFDRGRLGVFVIRNGKRQDHKIRMGI
jgi:hypothetical protein